MTSVADSSSEESGPDPSWAAGATSAIRASESRVRWAREVAQALAKHALDEGRTQDALTLCHEMIAYDPCDEPAREIAIRAYLESGDRAAALRHFRQYRDVLQAELQCEPSESLAELVGAGA